MSLVVKKHGVAIKVGGPAKVIVEDGDSPLYGIVVRRAKKSAAVQITERNPLWFGAVVSSREVHRVEACDNEDMAVGQLAVQWGVSKRSSPVRCKTCRTMNTIFRLDNSECLSCVMKSGAPAMQITDDEGDCEA